MEWGRTRSCLRGAMTLVNSSDRTNRHEEMTAHRRLPIGAELMPGAAGVHFRVWAPARRNVDVVFDSPSLANVSLVREVDGYFAGLAPAARSGARYRFRLDGD